MATLHHHLHHHHTSRRRHSLDYSSLPSSTSSSSSLSLKHHHHHHHHHPPSSTLSLSTPHTTTLSLSSTATSASATTTAATPDTAFSLDALERHLAAGNLRQADEETRRLLIVLAGEPAVKRGYVFFSEVQFIPKDDLKAIDELWRKFSNNRFGYSVQKKIWLKLNKDFTKFFIKVGWMKKLDTEVEQYNYRSFPNEFLWELNLNDKNNTINGDNNNGSVISDNGNGNGSISSSNSSSSSNTGVVPPEGHLPLTNALRGTQLLSCILTHPAFDDDDGGGGEEREKGERDDDDDADKKVNGEVEEKKSRLASLRDRLFKPSYTF